MEIATLVSVTRIPKKCKHAVNHVGVLRIRFLRVGQMVVNDHVDVAIDRLPCHLQPLVDALQVHPPQPWEEVTDVELPKEFRVLLQYAGELALVPVALRPESCHEGDVLGEGEGQIADIDGRPAPSSGEAGGGVDLVADRRPRLDAPAAEELHDAELARLAPEGTVVGEGHVGTVVGEVRDGGGCRTTRPAPAAPAGPSPAWTRRRREGSRGGGGIGRRISRQASRGRGESAGPSCACCR